jgi:hypothetical protein
MKNSLTFTLPQCLCTDAARDDFKHQLVSGLANGNTPTLCLAITPHTTDKDIYQAIQIISAINKFLDVSFQLLDDDDVADLDPKAHPAWGYLKICQSWLPNATVIM